MKKVVGAIPILAVLVLVFVGLVGTQIASAAVDITPSKPNPVPGDDEGSLVDTYDANFNTVITLTVTGASTQTGTLGNVIETLTVTIDADESGDVLFLELTETGIATGIFDGSFKVVDDTSSSTSPSSLPGPADGKAADTPRLATEDEDLITIVSGTTSEKVDVENDEPNLGELDPEHEDVVDDGDVDFTIESDDADSGIPEPEDLPDNDGDEDYMSVVFLKSDVQCTDAELITELSTGNQPLNKAKIEDVDCGGSNNVLTIIQVTDESDYDEIDDGFEIDHTIVLGEGTSYIGLIAYDNAGNAEIFDADDTDNTVALAEIVIDETDPNFFSIRTGVAYDTADDEYSDDERDWIQVILKDATDLEPDSIDADDIVVEGHTVVRAVWYDVDPEEIEGGPDAGTPTIAGPKDVDGNTKAVCSLAGAVVNCNTADASILRPSSWIPGQAVSATRPDNNGFFFIRNSIFVQLDDELDPDEEPQVNVVPDGIDDEAGNTIDDGEDDATDLIPPGFTVVSLEGPIAGEPLLAGEDDAMDMVITSDEELSKKPTVTVTLVQAPDGCVVNGVVQNVGNDTHGNACPANAIGGTLSASVNEVGTNRWEVEIDDPADTGYYNILIVGTDENSVDGSEGIATADIGADFFEDDGDVNEDDATFFEGDVFISDPLVEVAGQDAADDPAVEFRDPLFVTINFKKRAVGETDNEEEEYAEDSFEEVTVTKFELDGVDLTDEVTTTDDQVFTIPIAGIDIGDHEIVIQAEDEAGNELDDDLELDFEVEARDAFELEVNPGWNFKSLPGTAADPMLSAIFEGSSVSTIYTYDPTVPGGWLVAVFDDGEGEWVGDFDMLEVTRAYWMNATEVEAIEIDIPRIVGGTPGEGATPVLPPVLDMVIGWNMTPLIDVSGDVEFGDTVDADVYFASVNAEVGRIVTYDTITNSWDTVNFTEDPVNSDGLGGTLDDPDLAFGNAYWTYMIEEGTLAPP